MSDTHVELKARSSKTPPGVEEGITTLADRQTRAHNHSRASYGQGSTHNVLGEVEFPYIQTWVDMDGHGMQMEWRNDIYTPVLQELTGPSGSDCLRVTIEATGSLTPMDAFLLFFTTRLENLFVIETNACGVHQVHNNWTTWKSVTIDEFEVSLAILVFMGVVRTIRVVYMSIPSHLSRNAE